MSKKPFAWSFSKLESFEMCPAKFAAESITKTAPFTESEASRYGKFVHKCFEDRLVAGKTLPLDLTHHEPIMEKLSNANGESLGEQKLALTVDLKPTGYFDDDVWLRGIIDFTSLGDTKVLVVDFKTGRMKAGTDQVELMLAMLFCYRPELEWGTGSYFWAKNKKFTTTGILSRDDIKDVWAKFLPRVDAMYKAIDTNEFPPRQCFLCKNYCNVSHCPFNGV